MLTNQWGRCPWSETWEKDKIHPSDLDKFIGIYSPYAVFECIGSEDNYIKVRRGECKEIICRVAPDLFQEIPEPKYKVGDTVLINDSVNAVIIANSWHSDKQEHYYFVTVNGKKKSRRYYEADFSECQQESSIV